MRTVSRPWTPEALRDYRLQRYRQRSDLRLQSRDEAETWLNQVGLCLFQSKQGVELPSLWGAVAGTDDPAPRWGSHSYLYGRAWEWKDQLLCSRRIYYGKALGDYRLFVSLEVLPYLFALSELNYGGDEDDYLELYADGKLSLEARNIYQVIVERGRPTSTTILRRRLGMKDGRSSQRFERGLAELQRGLLIGAVDIARDNRWKYTFAYDLTRRQFPQQVARARQLSRLDATSFLLPHYLALVGCAPLAKVARLFGWREDFLAHVARQMAEGGAIGLDEGPGVVWAPVPPEAD